MGGTPADGTAFTTFLPGLDGAGFAGHHDWRLPTQVELLTITLPGYPDCTAPPCIDPIFGPTVPGIYWSGVTPQTHPTNAWSVNFTLGGPDNKNKTESTYVRAVRGGF